MVMARQALPSSRAFGVTRTISSYFLEAPDQLLPAIPPVRNLLRQPRLHNTHTTRAVAWGAGEAQTDLI